MSLIRKIITSELIFIAEIGINHNGDAETALRMVEAAAAAGAHAVKFQTMEPAEMYSVYTSALLEKGREEYADRRQIDFFSGFTLAENDYAAIKEKALSLGMVFFSAPFDVKSVELLERLGAPLYKLASSEVTNRGLLELVASTGKPVIMSTGICTEEEISRALETLDAGGCPEVLLLHCVSLYP
ncbi:MAG TPA: N-acetylneuraminate synthase, partial [Spirochaetes bacterium]|nr:N-acetylneuraminate synthase [Spirochaetota bacterium]